MATIVLPNTWDHPEYTFEVVDEWPIGYTVWNIGFHEELAGEGYIPLCQCDANYHIDAKRLKALKIGDRRICGRVMKAAGRYTMTHEKFIRFMELRPISFDL